MRTWKLILIPILLSLVLIGCAGTATNPAQPPAAPTDPRVVVAQYCQLLAHSAAVAGKEAIVAHQNKLLDDPTFVTIAGAIKAADKFARDATAEAASGDAWTVARVKIAGLGAGIAINAAVSDPTLQSELTEINSGIQQILGVQ